MRTASIFSLVIISLVALSSVDAQEPKHYRLAEFGRMVKRFPKDIGFGFSGAAFFQKQLYVSCNLGLLVISEGGEVELLQWQGRDAVIEGPWLDRANGAVWAQQASSGSLVRFDGKKWDIFSIPKPSQGDFSRGDFLSGFRGVSSKQTFYLEGGGSVWGWNPKDSGWKLELSPPLPLGSSIRAYLPYHARPIYVVGSGYDPEQSSIYRFSGKWQQQSVNKSRVKETVAADAGAYLRTEDGKVFECSGEKPVRLDGPEPCEAITRTSAGELLASFAHKGVFQRAGDAWKLKLKSPFPEGEGAHWAHLAEADGRIALVTFPAPNYLGEPSKKVYTGTVGIWISKDGAFERVRMEP